MAGGGHPAKYLRGLVTFTNGAKFGDIYVADNSTGLTVGGAATVSGALVATGAGTFASVVIGSNTISTNTTGLTITNGLKVSNKAGGQLTANTTGLIFPTVAAKPSARSSCKFVVLRNSTGKNYISINATGATWVYLQTTTSLPSVGYS